MENYKVYYSNELIEIHKGSVSVSADMVDLKERTITSYERIISARKVYLDYIK